MATEPEKGTRSQAAFLQNIVIAHLHHFYHKAWVFPRKELNSCQKSYSDNISACLWAFLLHSNGQSPWNIMKAEEFFLQTPLALTSNAVLSNLTLTDFTKGLYILAWFHLNSHCILAHADKTACIKYSFLPDKSILHYNSLLMKHAYCCWSLGEEK